MGPSSVQARSKTPSGISGSSAFRDGRWKSGEQARSDCGKAGRIIWNISTQGVNTASCYAKCSPQTGKTVWRIIDERHLPAIETQGEDRGVLRKDDRDRDGARTPSLSCREPRNSDMPSVPLPGVAEGSYKGTQHF